MTTETTSLEIIPYGLPKGYLKGFKFPGLHISKGWNPSKEPDDRKLLVTFSGVLDDAFARVFQQNATRSTRLLVLNDCPGSDRLASRLVHLQIRSPERFYVAEGSPGADWFDTLQQLLGRLSAARDPKGSTPRILDARLESGVLRVISTDFQRLEIPIAKLPVLARTALASVANVEIDEDGSYLYWPKLDVHLGWDQLAHVLDPAAAQKAKQKSRDFNVRYGAAVRLLRERKGLSLKDIAGLSDKQLRRIEHGDCRLTSNAAERLAHAHGMTPNDYLQAVSAELEP
jgi:hypothetical protein